MDEQPPTTPPARRHWWNWAYTPFLVIGIAVIPNTIMIISAKQRGVDTVLDNAYLASASFDEEQTERRRFDAADLELGWQAIQAGTLRFELRGLTAGEEPVRAELRFYRPADRQQDRQVAWGDARQPLTVQLPSPGNWFVEVVAEIADTRYRHRVALYL